MMGYALTEEQSRLLEAAISDLLVLSEADAVFISDQGGNLIVHSAARNDDSSLQTLAALAAGSFCATRELAAMIGEPAFHSIFHQGQHASIYMQSVTPHFLILVIYGKSTTAGLVKLYVEKAGKEIEPVLNRMESLSIADAIGSDTQTFQIDQNAEVFKKKK